MPTTSHPSITLEKYIDKQLSALCDKFDMRFQDIDKATMLKSRELEAHLQTLNNTYAFLKDSQANTISRDVFDAKMEVIQKQLSSIERWQSNMDGRLLVIPIIISAVVSIVAALVLHFIIGGA